MIKYLNFLGFDDINNDLFKKYSKYFRNCLVLANYSNLKERIFEDKKYLYRFFDKMLVDSELELLEIEGNKHK